MKDNLISNEEAIKILQGKIKMLERPVQEDSNYTGIHTLIKAFNTAIKALEKEVNYETTSRNGV